jgi:GNAT superfamily N-acetyltransferase
LDISRIVAIDERLTGIYRPDVWERRVGYYIRRDAEACPVAEVDGKVVGFMFSDVRGGEFGLEETSGWIERFGVDPDYQGRGIFTRLTLHAIDELAREGVAFVFNTPNDQSRPGYLKMGWEVVGQLPTLVRPTRWRSLARIAQARVPAERWSTPSGAGVDALTVLEDRDGLDALLDRAGPSRRFHEGSAGYGRGFSGSRTPGTPP